MIVQHSLEFPSFQEKKTTERHEIAYLTPLYFEKAPASILYISEEQILRYLHIWSFGIAYISECVNIQYLEILQG